MKRFRSVSAAIAVGGAAMLGGCVAPGPYYAASYPYYGDASPVVVSPSLYVNGYYGWGGYGYYGWPGYYRGYYGRPAYYGGYYGGYYGRSGFYGRPGYPGRPGYYGRGRGPG